jgi:Transposase DDE domain
MNKELLGALSELMKVRFSGLNKPIRKNLVVLTFAFILVLSAVRSGQGRLSLAALARALPTQGTAHAREKRLHRFLKNSRLDFRTVTGSLATILLAPGKRFCPVILDQTKSGSAQALLAAVPYAGRSLPLACYTFAYPLTEPALKSQNQLEHIFLLDTETSLPPGVTAVWIADRAYARSLLLQQSEQEQRPYLVRGRKETIITYQGRRMKLGQLHALPRKALRYENVLYHAQRKVPVDVIVYYEPTYAEPWYLLVPVAYRKLLETDLVVDLYRERMQIEQSFRDFKTHLGLRGLRLQIDIAPRMGRLLLAFCLAYILCVLLGESPLGEQARKGFEIPRRMARHGTRRTLSALSMAMLILSHPAWIQRAIALLMKIIWRATKQRPLLSPSQLYLPKSLGP